MKLHLNLDTIYYGLIAQDSFADEKATRLLNEVQSEVSRIYKSNVAFMHKQTNLEKNCLDKYLR
jgi:hypothetical protein